MKINAEPKTPLLKRLETQVTRKQWAVFLLIPVALHKFGKIEFKVLIPTGPFSKDNVFDFGLE